MNVTIITDPAERFKALEMLRSAAWKSFDRRREYEWKFGITLWSALAAFIALLFRAPTPSKEVHGVLSAASTAAFGALLIIIHVILTRGWSKANDRDRNIARVFEKKMCDLIEINHDKEILCFLPKDYHVMGPLRNYSHFGQVAVTFVLVVAAFLAVLSLAGPPA